MAHSFQGQTTAEERDPLLRFAGTHDPAVSIRPRFRPPEALLTIYVIEMIGRSGEIRTPDPLLPKQVLC